MARSDTNELKPCPLCASAQQELVRTFDQPCDGENTFGVPLADYRRDLLVCRCCGLFRNLHSYDLAQVYEGAYQEAAYHGARMQERFRKVMNLPEAESDNRQRVNRLLGYMSEFRPQAPHQLMDVGSGMGVFPAVMKEKGWGVLAVDPDETNIKNARDNAGVEAVCASFPDLGIDRRFALVTFNKVLEHIEDVVSCLAATHQFLTDDGVVYIELPDGEAAIDASAERQEFFLEHYYAFSAASIVLLAARAGFRLLTLDRIRDPSGKYTLSALVEH